MRQPTTRTDLAPSATMSSLYRLYAPWLRSALRRRLGHDRVDDAVHEAFKRVLAYGPLSLGHPKAFRLRVATTAAAAEGKRNARLAGAAAAHTQSFRQNEQSDQLELLSLKQVIAALPEPLRDTFVLSRILGLSYKEIAERQGIAVKTVEWRMSRALEICRALLMD